MRRFEGKVALVTGAGRGIGREEALLLSRHGAKVVVNDIGGDPHARVSDPKIAEAVVQTIRSEGGEAIADTSRVSSMEGGRQLIENAMDHFGRIDILINNAGVASVARIDQMTEEDFDNIVAVNLKGYFATIRYAAPHLMKCGGAIVNTSSPSGFGHYGMSTYTMAKEGVIGLTRTVARDLGQFGVRCNAIRPMAGRSAMTTPEVIESVRFSVTELGLPAVGHFHLNSGGFEGFGLPEHVAAGSVWLCTDEAAPLNGRELFISGGHVALVQQPELIRSQFMAGGWSFEKMCEPETTAALTVGAQDLSAAKRRHASDEQ